MLKETAKKRLSEYNSIIKETDELYRKIAKTLDLSDCTFWILYILREDSEILTQSEICSAIYQPKQTINSALKKLQNDGYIELKEMNDRRSKQVVLTLKGRQLAEKTVDKVIIVEQKALAELTEEEQKTFIGLFRKYTDLFKNHISELSED